MCDHTQATMTFTLALTGSLVWCAVCGAQCQADDTGHRQPWTLPLRDTEVPPAAPDTDRPPPPPEVCTRCGGGGMVTVNVGGPIWSGGQARQVCPVCLGTGQEEAST